MNLKKNWKGIYK